ncbi:MAG: LLM class flavin-dependent oxidoreductase, partial [Acidimicrobiales bacterium]
AGWYDDEHTAYGIPFPPLWERFERLEEQLAVITGLWGTPLGGRFSFEGKHYQLSDSPGLPKPVQAPGPPVIVGGAGPRRTPRLAATFAHEFNMPFCPVADTDRQYERVRVACASVGRDPASVVFSAAQTVCCGRNQTEIAARAESIGRGVDELREDGLCGTPDEVVSKLATFAEVGAGRVYLQLLDLQDHDHLTLLGQEVLPGCAPL